MTTTVYLTKRERSALDNRNFGHTGKTSTGKKRPVVLCRLYNLQRGVCALCGEKMTLDHDMTNTATLDHIIPRSRGGHNGRKNLQAACFRCNNKKGNEATEEEKCERANYWKRFNAAAAKGKP